MSETKSEIILDKNEVSTVIPIVSPKSTTVEKPRYYYIDNLRFFLTFLVVIHHCFWVVIAGWHPFYRPWQLDTPSIVLGYMLLSGNQSYFMGLFFFLSGLTTIPSLKRKGSLQFIKDRFIRLVIPVIIYELVLFPLLYCFLESTWYGPQRGTTSTINDVWVYYFQNYHFTSNQMWFTITLFFFNIWTIIIYEIINTKLISKCSLSLKYLTYCCCHRFDRHIAVSSTTSSTDNTSTVNGDSVTSRDIAILLCKISFLSFILNYIMRIFFSENGYIWVPVLANLGFIMQYIIAYILGIVANSLQFLDFQLNKEYIIMLARASINLYFTFETCQTYSYIPLITYTGFYVSTLLITFFEQFFAIFFSMLLLVLFKIYWNTKPKYTLVNKIINASYATYIIHQWIIIPVAVGLAYTNIHPFGVIIILCFVTPILSFGCGIGIKLLPKADMIV